MNVSLLTVPWDSGHYGKRMGKGPIHIVEQGLVEHLEAGSNDVELIEIRLSDSFFTEIGTAKSLNTKLSQAVKNACAEKRFPVVLAGNCNTAIGTVAGLGLTQPGVIWFDAHADFNTPETTTSGFFDGMGLSILIGNCWEQWRNEIPGFVAVKEQNVILIGARDFGKQEQELLYSSAITLISVSDIRENVKTTYEERIKLLSGSCNGLYVHIDLDVFDPRQLKANHFYTEEGSYLEEIKATLRLICTDFNVKAISFTSYDPDSDPENKGYRIVKSILDTILLLMR